MVKAAAEMESEINRLQMEHAKNLEGMDGEQAMKAEQELERKILEKGNFFFSLSALVFSFVLSLCFNVDLRCVCSRYDWYMENGYDGD